MSVGAPKIRVLPPVLVDQIAAGEVVERPASVVRELVDNAIDAGATRIDVELEGGGRSLVKVSDDGGGIVPEDLPLAFASHATSKLLALADLDAIATMGFRGEALASIGAVSRAKIRSRADAAPHAAEVDDEGGVVSAARPAARARGTDVEVRDLFFNTPARRRFLRRDATEAGHAVDVVVRLALAHAETAFRVVVDGKLVFDAAREESGDPARVAAARRARIRRAFGAEAEEDLCAVRAEVGGLVLEGFVGTAATARSNAGGVHFFVNRRFVQDRGALRVVREATRDFVGSKVPMAFLFLAIDPARVDVNVHPAKLEVRFREPGAVYGLLHSALRRALEGERPAAPADALLQGALRALGSEARPPDSWGFEAREIPASGAPPRAAAIATGGEGALFGALPAPAPALPRSARFLRAFDTFLVLESGEGIDLVDQHALHERVNFESLRARAGAGEAPRQRLLVPESLEVSGEEMGLAEEHAESWQRAGVEVVAVGPRVLAVRAVPAGLPRLDPRALVRDLLALARERRDPSPAAVLEELLHRCACHASVKAGDRLSDDEIASLLVAAARLPAEQTCPHGRPTRIRLTLRDLERAFERR